MRVLLPVQTVWLGSPEGSEGNEVRFPGDGCTLQDSLLDRSLRLGVRMRLEGSVIMTVLAAMASGEVEVVWVEVRAGNLLRRELVDQRYSLRVLVPFRDVDTTFSPQGRKALNEASGCIVDLQEVTVSVRTGPSDTSLINACWAYLRPKMDPGRPLVYEGPRALEL